MAPATADTLQARKARWREFLEPTTDRPAAPRQVFLIHCDAEAPERPWPWPDNVPRRIDWAWNLYRRQVERAEWLDDDALPYLDPYTGTEIFAEAFGCAVYRPADTMPSARPRVASAAEADRLAVPDIDCEPLARLFGIADELRRRAGDHALMRLPDIQSPMDIAALIWDKNEFFPAMLQAPGAVRRLADKVRRLLTAFLDEWFTRYGREFIAHYPVYYMPRGVTVSEDEIGAVSARTCRELFLPELADLSRRYGGIGVHCCAHARHQWGNFKAIPDLRLLNLVQSVEVQREAYPYFAGHTAQMHGWCGEGEPWTWPAQLPADARVVLQASAETKDEAAALAEKMRRALGRA